MIRIEIQKSLHGSRGDINLDVKLAVKQGEFIALMGESGAGKTTILRVLAGLEEAQGKISVGGKVWLDAKTSLVTQKRGIGFVFQDYALFENMSVEQNLLFVRKNRTLAAELLKMTELDQLKERNVSRLSGGQKQRVSLCRAMMNEPTLLLMDEPLSALDPAMRIKLQKQIKKLHVRFGTTTIMVSHDIGAVHALASRIITLEDGRITRDGTLKEVLLKQDMHHKAEVLEIETSRQKRVAIVSFLGELLSVEVNDDIKVGDMLEFTLNGEQE